MPTLKLELRGEGVFRRVDRGAAGFLKGDAARLEDWAERYGRAAISEDVFALAGIGEEMFSWLDTGGVAVVWAVSGEPVLDVRVDPAIDNVALADALLDTPWELLAPNGVFLASDPDRLFSVARRVAPAGETKEPTRTDVSLMFMAAAPLGQLELDFEAEEAAILEATRAKAGGRPLAHVSVEESGNVDLLGQRLTLDGPFEVLHLSCHGTLDEDNGPVLALETEVGEADYVTPGRLLDKLGPETPPLVFVSACRTAERGGAVGPVAGGEGYRDSPSGNVTAGASPDLTHPYVRRLAGRVANVLGWDGSVRDADATRFAEEFYGALARRALFQSAPEDPNLGRHWHLARVYLGSAGGGPLCVAGGKKRKAAPRGELAFLDVEGKRVPVATRAQFVGRRRLIQQVLRAYRNEAPGVLIYGMGNLGKSSLAARVASRMAGHTTAVVYGRYDALSIFDELVKALPAKTRLSLKVEIDGWRASIEVSEKAFEDVLAVVLEGPLDAEPVLVVVDDLEQALEDPVPEHDLVEPKPAYQVALRGLLRAFAQTQTASRLLLTSRYLFAVLDETGNNLAGALHTIQVSSMRAREQAKQWRAAARATGDEAIAGAITAELLGQTLAAAAGNPGLQEILTRPLLEGESEAARAAVQAVELGEIPADDNLAFEFFRRVSFETYAKSLTGTQVTMLRASTLLKDFVPIPLTALEAAARAFGVSDPASALSRLIALGLLDV